jgi:HK97 family phage portal protein
MAFWTNWFRKKSTTVNIPNTGTARWPERNYQNFADEGYLKSVDMYRCVNEVAMACASVPWKVYNEKEDGTREINTEHPVNKLLKRPNPQQGWSALILETVSYIMIAGNTFPERISPTTGDNAGVPKEIGVIRPDRIKVIVHNDTGELLGYELNEEGVAKKVWKIDPVTGQCDLLHLKMFHPTNDIMGASPVEASAKNIDTANEATEWNKKLLENEARPGMLFMFKQALGDKQYERFKADLKENQSGAENAGKSLIIEGDGEAKPYGYNMQELDFIQGGREKSRQIARGFFTPSQIIGIIGDSTFANYETAEQSFWEKIVFYMLSYMRDELNNWLFTNEDAISLDFVLDGVPALEPRQTEKWKRAQESEFLTINEKREMVGLDSIDDGDVVLVQASMIPLGTELEEDEADEEEEIFEDLDKAGVKPEDAEELMGLKN